MNETKIRQSPSHSRQKQWSKTMLFIETVTSNRQPLVPSRLSSPFVKFAIFSECHIRLLLVHNDCSVVSQVCHTASESHDSSYHHHFILFTINKSAKITSINGTQWKKIISMSSVAILEGTWPVEYLFQQAREAVPCGASPTCIQ